MSSYQVRRAKVEDAPEIAAVHVRSWQVAYRGHMPDDFLAQLDVVKRTELWNRIAQLSGTDIFVLGDELHRVIGFTTLIPSRDADADGNTGEIGATYVDPEKWRNGAGRLLMSTSLARARERQFSSVTLWVLEANLRARSFYESFGFLSDGQSKDVHFRSDFVIREVRYHLKLQ